MVLASAGSALPAHATGDSQVASAPPVAGGCCWNPRVDTGTPPARGHLLRTAGRERDWLVQLLLRSTARWIRPRHTDLRAERHARRHARAASSACCLTRIRADGVCAGAARGCARHRAASNRGCAGWRRSWRWPRSAGGLERVLDVVGGRPGTPARLRRPSCRWRPSCWPSRGPRDPERPARCSRCCSDLAAIAVLVVGYSHAALAWNTYGNARGSCG